MHRQHTNATTPEEGEELSRAFGARVRRLRDAAGLTLEQLSQRSGVSRAMLSKVERGEKNPTIGVATRIAQSLQTSLTELVGGSVAGGAVALLRRADRPIFRDPETGFERHIVSPATGGGRVELIYHALPPGISTGLLPAYPAGTEKQVVVTIGNLVVEFKDTKQYLGPGDALFFQADVDHAFANHTAEPCGYFMVVSRDR
ncbi:helix-turn-helix domain-containing protein [Halotalea alkalilenta]|uniref:XRE family transcriptional regulator n=1 Tax=Halotalea alkalilenta TaxID=376489 RepID=A0A172YKR6_9GAMM|nr:XRE family transcriptional regulator [Halotalea alkalilenta]ANF59585.1 XRE family transcriptional regulator [Halotalea alkalilenta]